MPLCDTCARRTVWEAGGAIIIFSPGISTLALALLLGFWLVAYGLTLVISSFVLRSHTSGVRAVLSPRHT